MSLPRRPRVLLADDHLLVAEALKSLLTPEFDLVGVVEDGRALVEAAGRLRPDVIVADITMPHLNGIDALVQLRQGGDRGARRVSHHAPGCDLRAARARSRGLGVRAQALGVGRVDRRPPRRARGQDLPHAAARGGGPGGHEAGAGAGRRSGQRPHAAATGGPSASGGGASAKQIAASLSISTRTVEFHKYQMMETLGLHTNAELIHFAIKNGLVEF